MFVVKPIEDVSIKYHFCYSDSVAQNVFEYIDKKYNIDLELKEVDGLPYFDAGGALLIDPFFTDIELKYVECRIDHLDILIEAIESKKYSKNNFCRIRSMHSNLCFSEKELQEIKDYIKNNKDELDKILESVDVFWKSRYKNYDASS